MGRFFNIFPTIESRDPKIAFTCCAKARTWGTDDMAGVEKFIEEIPTGELVGGFDPNIGSVDAAVDG